MSQTDYISDYTIVDLEGDLISFREPYRTRIEAESFLAERAKDIEQAIAEEVISGAQVHEERTPAVFFVTSRACEPYLNFGSRIVAEAPSEPLVIVGVPVAHAAYVSGRMQSGLVGHAGPYASLEEAAAMVPVLLPVTQPALVYYL